MVTQVLMRLNNSYLCKLHTKNYIVLRVIILNLKNHHFWLEFEKSSILAKIWKINFCKKSHLNPSSYGQSPIQKIIFARIWKIINFGWNLKNHFSQKKWKFVNFCRLKNHFLQKIEESSIFAKICKKKISHGGICTPLHMVTHPSTDEAQCCLTFKISKNYWGRKKKMKTRV